MLFCFFPIVSYILPLAGKTSVWNSKKNLLPMEENKNHHLQGFNSLFSRASRRTSDVTREDLHDFRAWIWVPQVDQMDFPHDSTD